MQIEKLFTLAFYHIRKPMKLSCRFMSSNTSVSLKYKQYGEPNDVLQIAEDCVPEPTNKQVVVRWLLAPVNPADINTIQGKYPSKPTLPAVPGNEGVGEIVAVGSNDLEFKIGDKVIPNTNNLGTWRTKSLHDVKDILKVSKELGTVEASMLTVNPCTAYRMLKDFVSLNPEDTIIQNGGNSAVGQLVIQLCKAWNLNSVNIVRSRPDIDKLKSDLLGFGATEVLTEEELRTTDIFKSKKLKKPKLALNCICGKNALELQRHLDHGGVMVTYGGMSREPLTIPASSLIFKDIAFKGFWMTAWTKKNSESKERYKMIKELEKLFIENKLCAPGYKLIPLCDYQEAVINTLKPDGKKGIKYILDMTSM